ncbi:MAG: ribonuclease R [Legionellales bacterium]|nr:ribonuclease R [Legionellales bacterium]
MGKRKKFSRKSDPHSQREAQKYQNPIPSREYLLNYLETYGKPATFEQIIDEFELQDEQEQEALTFRLKAMVRDRQVMLDRRGRVCLLNKLMLVAGRVEGHPDGFGYLIPDDGSEDLFLSPKQMRKVLHGDRALVNKIPSQRRGKFDGVIHEVLERANQQIVGRFYKEQNVAFVEPENRRINQDIHISQTDIGGAANGQVVLVDIVGQPSTRSKPIGKVTKVLGDHLDPGMEIDVALYSHNLPHEWPAEVFSEIERFGKQVKPGDKLGRTDCRELHWVTIDGADAKDFDDAVYCESLAKGKWKLLVAIADVSHYVTVDSALDQEALLRGNSVYFPNRVIPMLPPILSNQLCSLKPKVDRLSVVCEMHINQEGTLENFRFYDAVIHSHARLTYDNVQKMLDGDQVLQKKYQHVWPQLKNLQQLFNLLITARQQRGAIDFDTVETRFQFDDNGKIKKILPTRRHTAHRIIEECMLLANVSASRFLQEYRLPGIFRVHDRPAVEKIEDLRSFLGELGIHLTGGEHPTTKDFAKILHQVADRPDKELIQTVLLRSLKQAEYATENVGHFGLAYTEYTHFTSPIRRYPDLLVHRMIKHILHHQSPEQLPYNVEQLQQMATHCSTTERRADEATYDVIAWLKCEFMQDKLGQVFSGRVTSVTGFGVFVQLDDVFVEGLIHVTNLPKDYYRFDPVRHRLTGERTGRAFRLTDPVTVLVTRVDLDERKIDFDWVDVEE